ncbi:unnamed protein product [Hyaloperonospora brassicae]|uniref:RxLR effector candidate protein n=1 Tax=Hyaloperonospora brassicae TaxID=162125 RepID=A0AAV0U2T4_HYABA|nr:unnamed protein product [Hyaloperonospora brassicae]
MKISISTGIVAGALLAVAALPSAFGESDTAALGAHLNEYGTIVRSLRGSTPNEADDPEEERSPMNWMGDLVSLQKDSALLTGIAQSLRSHDNVEGVFKIESLAVAPISAENVFQEHLAKELLSSREFLEWYQNAKEVVRSSEFAAFNHLEAALGAHDLAVMIDLVRSKKLKVPRDAKKVIEELEKKQFEKWVLSGYSQEVVSETILRQPEGTIHPIADKYEAYVTNNRRKKGFIWTP